MAATRPCSFAPPPTPSAARLAGAGDPHNHKSPGVRLRMGNPISPLTRPATGAADVVVARDAGLDAVDGGMVGDATVGDFNGLPCEPNALPSTWDGRAMDRPSSDFKPLYHKVKDSSPGQMRSKLRDSASVDA